MTGTLTHLDKAKRDGQARAHKFNADNPPGSPVLAWPGPRHPGPGYEEPLQTRTRFSAWVLGDGHPVVTLVGFLGGISLDHIEPDPTRQPSIPDIDFETPPCPMCGTSLEADGDSLSCLPCGASWHNNGTDGRWADPAAVRCQATREGFGEEYPELPQVIQCVRANGHDLGATADDHVDQDGTFGTWHNADEVALTDGGGESTR